MTDEQMLTERALDVQRVLCAITRGQKVEIDYAKRVLMMFNQIVGGHPFEKESLIGKVIQSAILAEREACAKLAEDLAAFWKKEKARVDLNENAKVYCDGRILVLMAIATQIRARTASNLPQDQSETPSPAIPTPES